MTYVVIRLNGKQHKIAQGDEILVDTFSEKIAPEVLLAVDGDKVTIGEPLLKTPKVELKALGEEKGKKVRVLRYQAKSRRRKTTGSRAVYTRVKIEKIS